MKNKINKILLILMSLWFVVFVTDMLCFMFLSKPIFVISPEAGDAVVYYGLGYGFTIYYPLTTANDTRVYTPDIEILPYIVINIVLVAFIIFRIIRQRRKIQSGKSDSQLQ